jgi:hypothetical protein
MNRPAGSVALALVAVWVVAHRLYIAPRRLRRRPRGRAQGFVATFLAAAGVAMAGAALVLARWRTRAVSAA